MVMPKRRRSQAAASVTTLTGQAQAQNARPKSDIVIHRLREGIRLLKDHAHLFSEPDHIHAGIEDVLTVKEDLPFLLGRKGLGDGGLKGREMLGDGGFEGKRVRE